MFLDVALLIVSSALCMFMHGCVLVFIGKSFKNFLMHTKINAISDYYSESSVQNT